MQKNIPTNILQDISLETLQYAINHDFFMRVVLASLEIIRLLHTQDSLLHESFGIGAGGDKSSGADLLAEAIFCKFFSPNYHLDSEEAGFIEGDKNAKQTIILDPLDGSSNFKSNIPYYGASLALCDENGRVREACIVNYISHEISYLNDELLKVTKIPCVFDIDSIGLYLTFEDLKALQESQGNVTSSNAYSQNQALLYKQSFPLFLIDFSSLLVCAENNELNMQHCIQNICEKILQTKDYLPQFNNELLRKMFESKLLIYRPQQAHATKVLECGVFEKASYHHEWVALLRQKGLKFRSLGATAITLGFSFRYLFVLLPSKVRRYDGMAGLYLAQNQIIYGDLSDYYHAIPTLQKHDTHNKHIIIASDYAVIDKIIRS